MAAGRPPHYETPEDLQEAIDEYFNDVPTRTIYVSDKTIEMPIVTITGLTLALGFCDRASFYDYEKKGEFSHTIKTARLRVENDYEMQLRSSHQGQAGVIFGLKNLGWSDKQDEAQDSTDPNPVEVKIVVEDARKGE